MEHKILVKVTASITYEIPGCANDAEAIIRAREHANMAFNEPGWHVDAMKVIGENFDHLIEKQPPETEEKEKTLDDSLATMDAIAKMEDDWDGYGATAYPAGNILFYRYVLRNLKRQPDSITPTAANGLVMQYNAPDGIMYYNLDVEKLECVCVPDGNPEKAEERTFPDAQDPAVIINADIAEIYKC